MLPAQLKVVLTFIGTVDVEGPRTTSSSGNTFKSTFDVDLRGSFLGSPLAPPTVGVKSACR